MPTLRTFQTSDASAGELARIKGMVVLAFAGGFDDDDWAHALGGWHVVVVDHDGTALAHAAVVPRLLEVAGRPVRAGYVEAVATAPGRQGDGLGSLAMTEVGEIVRRDYELGALSTSRHAFYGRLGWDRWQGQTYVRDGSRLVRTQDEDDGVMVLRFGPSEDVDLSSTLACETRPGDDW